MNTSANVSKHQGSCHCGAVRFEVDVDPQTATRCNCSICAKGGSMGAMVKPAAFRLLSGKESLGSYVWGSKIGTRFFCKHCGVYCYGAGSLPELGGDFVSPNVNTLDDVDVAMISPKFWDGRHDNWAGGSREQPWPIFRETEEPRRYDA